MALIFLIRHGQASAHAEDYDQLSELGYYQCKRLKEYLQQERINPTSVYYGPRKRHLQSYQATCSSHWPAAKLLPALDEYPAHELLEYGMEQLLQLEPTLLENAQKVMATTGSAGPDYVVLLQHSARHWMHDRIKAEGIEPYDSYQNRMEQIITIFKQAKPDDCIVMFSSAGFISTLLTQIVEGSPEKSLNTAWALYNGAINVIQTREFIGIVAVNQIHYLAKNERSFI